MKINNEIATKFIGSTYALTCFKIFINQRHFYQADYSKGSEIMSHE